MIHSTAFVFHMLHELWASINKHMFDEFELILNQVKFVN
jgi:hypothetical protein